MARSHGRNTAVLINSVDISTFLNDSDWNRDPDKHDVTTYGKNDHVYDGGLKDGTTTLTGIYDTATTSGPAAVLRPLEGTTTTFEYRPEGTGAGKPKRTVTVLVGAYKEGHPVADYVRWTQELQHSDAVVYTNQ